MKKHPTVSLCVCVLVVVCMWYMNMDCVAVHVCGTHVWGMLFVCDMCT